MRAKGINYDTGVSPGGKITRDVFDSATVAREMQIIAEDLHCTAVRITGANPARLSIAAEHAVAHGLETWFAPFPCELTADQMRPYFQDCAERAEALRQGGGNVVLVTGCELSLFAAEFFPGDSAYARLAAAMSGDPVNEELLSSLPARLNAFLADTVKDARSRFGGLVSYASGPWEDIDWDPFDIVAVDAYRSTDNADTFAAQLQAHFAHGKPVVATEFGSCTYRGAGARGGMGWAIVDKNTEPPTLDGEYVRDESEQVTYLHEMLAILEHAGVDSAFWFTFANYDKTSDPDPHFDLDMASYGVVKVLPSGHGTAYPDMTWEPKAAFYALAEAYAS
jgi:hypothetical protein